LRKEAPAFRHGEELRLTQVPLPPFCKYIHQIAKVKKAFYECHTARYTPSLLFNGTPQSLGLEKHPKVR